MTAAEPEVRTAVDATARETGFSGVVRVDAQDWTLEAAYGEADRARGVAMTVDTRIGIASGAKTFTAMAVLRLVERGVLTLETTARELLRGDLPLIDDAVTVEHLLCHRSGIGDYLDEDLYDGVLDFELPVPVHTLDTAESYLPVLDGFPQKSPPGAGFTYNNGAFCVLALLAERAAGAPFHELVRTEVLEPGGLDRTAYLRSDELPGDAAWGYLEPSGLRTNVLRLPVVGGGDGGILTTAGDVRRLWTALDAGRILAPAMREQMWRSRSDLPDHEGYGLGVWRWGAAAEMRGSDAGASFLSVHLPGVVTCSVLSNTSEGAWPVVTRLGRLLFDGTAP